MSLRLTALFAAVVALTISPLAHAQDDVGTMRLGAYLALGLGGEIDLDSDAPAGSVDTDADPTVGFGLRAEVPVHEYVAVGGLFELLTFESDVWGERESVFDIDVWVKGRYRFELAPGLILEPYIGVPFGLSLAVLADPNDLASDAVWPGFNIGVLAGAAVLLQERFGAFLELGWRHHQVFAEANTFLGDIDFAVKTNQVALHLGFMVAF